MKARRRISKKVVFLIGIVSVFLALYIQFGLFPGKLKIYAVEKVDALTQTSVDFSKILYIPFEGLVFQNVKVMTAEGQPLFSANALVVDVSLWKFLKDKKIIISRLILDSPVYDLVLNAQSKKVIPPTPKTKISGQIAVPTVASQKKNTLEDIESGPDAFLPEDVYIEGLEISNGFVRIRNSANDPELEELRGINVRLGFRRPPLLMFDGSLELGRSSYARISLNGSWDLKKGTYQFYLLVKSNRVPPWLLEYQKNHSIALKKGQVALELGIRSLDKESQILFHSKADLYDAELAMNQSIYTGQMRLDALGLFQMTTRSFLRYKGTLDFVNVAVDHLSKDIDRLEKISGRMSFDPNMLKLESLKGVYKNLAFEAKGKIESFKELLVDVTIESQATVQEILSLVPNDQKKFLKDFSAQGICKSVTSVKGSLRQLKELRVGYDLLISETSLKGLRNDFLLADISARIISDASGVYIKDGQALHQNTRYFLKAFFPKDKLGTGNAHLRSKDFALSGDYAFLDDGAEIKKARFETEGAQAEFKGKVTHWNSPSLDLIGNAHVDLLKIRPRLNEKFPTIKDLALRGILSGLFTLSGTWNDPLDWDLKIDATSGEIILADKFHLTNNEMQIRMANKIMGIPYARADLYGGSLGAELSFQLGKPDIFFSARINASNVDLHSFVQNMALGQRDYAGNTALQLKISGILSKPESFLGQGTLTVQNGFLWRTNLFKQMGELPLVKVEGLDTVIFQSLSANFDISEKKFLTDNLHVSSDTVDLDLSGNIGFDQTLDLLMDIHFSKDIIRGAYDTGGIVPFVVTQADNLISQYQITGTLKTPKYEKLKMPPTANLGKKVSDLVS